MNKYIFLILALLAVRLSFCQHSPRAVIDFNRDWKFLLGNDSAAINPDYDDSRWRPLDLPHDWSIEGNFSNAHPATTQEGALPTGIGWYRKTFRLSPSSKNKNVHIEFDGIYRNSEVWINGHYLGLRPNGYISFHYDLTPYLRSSPAENIIAIKVDNSAQPNSRWYSGSGIYRDVRLLLTNQVAAIVPEETFITVSGINHKTAKVNVSTKITLKPRENRLLFYDIAIYDDKGKLASAGLQHFRLDKFTYPFTNLEQTVTINDPRLWSPSDPYLYKAVIKITEAGRLIDEYTANFGIRDLYFDKDKGFFLNGHHVKINGVCLHHDLGALGAAFNIAAAKRQLLLLKKMGCNAIRTAHNPPAPQFLDLCDQMGFLVMDEAFDIWRKRKSKFDYHLDFDEWHKKDLEDMVKRDRNHPSVFIWSIGNEIREQFDSTGIAITRELVNTIKQLDTTRPVTSALTENFPGKNFIYLSGALDVLGFNYKLNDYKELPSRFPGQKFIATETASALATRGVYDQPSDSMRIWPPDSKQPFTNGNADMTVSAYDNTYAYWGATHEEAWSAVKKYDFIAGCFVWCGFDFLGEPVPYPWPARSSYYGIIDLAGFPKDIYYMYQSEWTDKPVLHLFPAWSGWKPGQTVDVGAYYNNADEVELFLNNKSLGIRKKTNNELHVMWRVSFAAGTLKAVSRRNGKIVLTKEIKTAGKPYKIELSADRKLIKADGRDLSFITARVVDDRGNLVPDVNNLIGFEVAGAGVLAGTDNGFEADTTSLKINKRNCWKGMALAIIQSTRKKGNITLKANADGLRSAVLILKTSL